MSLRVTGQVAVPAGKTGALTAARSGSDTDAGGGLSMTWRDAGGAHLTTGLNPARGRPQGRLAASAGSFEG